MTRLYCALVVDPLARVVDVAVELAGNGLDLSAGWAERYAEAARFWANASRLVP